MCVSVSTINLTIVQKGESTLYIISTLWSREVFTFTHQLCGWFDKIRYISIIRAISRVRSCNWYCYFERDICIDVSFVESSSSSATYRVWIDICLKWTYTRYKLRGGGVDWSSSGTTQMKSNNSNIAEIHQLTFYTQQKFHAYNLIPHSLLDI